MPLLSLNFPDTTRFVYSLIISISSFDVLPTDKIEGKIFNFKDNDTLLNDTNFNELGYESTVAISNIGSMFYYLVGIVLVIVLICVAKFFKDKYIL